MHFSQEIADLQKWYQFRLTEPENGWHGHDALVREKHTRLNEINQKFLRAPPADKQSLGLPIGIGPSTIQAESPGLAKVRGWLNGRDWHQEVAWTRDYGLSLVVFVPMDSILRRNLVEAQRDVANILPEGTWIPVKDDRFHMTVAPVTKRGREANANQAEAYSQQEIDAYVDRADVRIRPRARFTISFDTLFQSPVDGRINAQGIPICANDERSATTLRTSLNYLLPQGCINPLIHIGLGSIRLDEDLSPGIFDELHRLLKGFRRLGELSASRVCLVHHPNDHFHTEGPRADLEKYEWFMA